MSNRKQRKPLPYSPNTYSSMREQGSPTKASVLLQQDHEQYIQALKGKKQTFCSCLDIYRMSYQSELPQKCLMHNNFITLYCENQWKLLCVNCIYGSAIHNNHRVVPSKNSVQAIAKDNEENIRFLDEELERIKHIEIQMRKNKKTLDEEYSLIRKIVDEQFNEIYNLIKKKQAETRQRIDEAFSRAFTLTKSGQEQMNWWRQKLAKTKSTFPKSSSDEQVQVYKHLVLALFLQSKVEEEKLTYMASGQQIRTEFITKISGLRQMIEQYVGVGVGGNYQSERSKPRMF